MEGFLPTFPPYNVCGPGKREGRFATPQNLNYLELCKAILSQVHAGVPAAPRRAVTRECGVQVNAKVDKIVQCSLGPKTLSVCADGDRADASRRSPDAVKLGGRSPQNTPPVSSSSLRFVRPVSVYSPVFDRRLLPRKLTDGGASEEEEEEEEEEEDEDEEESRPEESERDAEDDADPDLKSTFHRSHKSPNFQFLEQRYGFFHCKKCNIRWESAYVWCISGTSKVYYKQLCRKCQVGFNPYRVESILCKGCSQTCCSCEKKQRHINMKRPHRQDLCCRCKGMRLSCDATYSFKYIL